MNNKKQQYTRTLKKEFHTTILNELQFEQTDFDKQINIENISTKITNIECLKENLLENIKILEIEISNGINKNMVVYQLVFCFELYLKYVLFQVDENMTFDKAKKYNHNIDIILRDIRYKSKDQIYDALEEKIKKIRVDGKKIDFNNYPNFKYMYNDNELLFKESNKFSTKEKKHIEEVIKCLKQEI